MAIKAKEKKQPKAPVYICSQCGQEISGDHVYIKTRRRTELHIHFGCMPGERNRNVISYSLFDKSLRERNKDGRIGGMSILWQRSKT